MLICEQKRNAIGDKSGYDSQNIFDTCQKYRAITTKARGRVNTFGLLSIVKCF